MFKRKKEGLTMLLTTTDDLMEEMNLPFEIADEIIAEAERMVIERNVDSADGTAEEAILDDIISSYYEDTDLIDFLDQEGGDSDVR